MKSNLCCKCKVEERRNGSYCPACYRAYRRSWHKENKILSDLKKELKEAKLILKYNSNV